MISLNVYLRLTSSLPRGRSGILFLPPATHFHITRRCCQVLVIGVENKNDSVSHHIGLDRCKWFHAASAVCTGPKQRLRTSRWHLRKSTFVSFCCFCSLLIFRLHKAHVGKVLFPLTRQKANSLTAYYVELHVPGLSRKSMDSSAEAHFKIKHQQTNAWKSKFLKLKPWFVDAPNPTFNFKYQLLYFRNS